MNASKLKIMVPGCFLGHEQYTRRLPQFRVILIMDSLYLHISFFRRFPKNSAILSLFYN